MRMIPPVLFVSGVVLTILSVIQGEASVGLMVFIPIVYGGGWMLGLGILFVFSSFISFFFLSGSETISGGDKRYGGVIFIGPIPMVFGSDKEITRTMLIIAVVLAIILLLAYALLYL